MYKYFQSSKNNSKKIQHHKEVKIRLQAFKNTLMKILMGAFKEIIENSV
jgi:hypothetical protein